MLVSTFRVYMPKRRGFWKVLVFDDAENLREHIASDDFPGGKYRANKGAVGFCRALTVLSKRGGWRPNPRGLRGIVAFALSHLGVRVASHEWTHAAHWELASHQGRDPLHLKDGERLAYLQCDLHATFWRLFHRRFRQIGKFRRGYPVWKARTA